MKHLDTESGIGPSNLVDHGVLERLKAIVGDEFVLSRDDQRDRYSNCTVPWHHRCAAVVFPGTREEIVGIVRLAMEVGVPIWPFSTGRNWGYGASLACENDAIIMIMERMNRVLEVNEELAYAVIEPGVTYQQLSDHLRNKGFKLWADCIDGTPHGSVIGNALERGVGETPYGDHFGNLCGLEVVLPNGEVVLVGATSEDQRTWHTHKWGLGPSLDGLFSQSNFGIVTRAGIWLMPEPEAYCSYVFEITDQSSVPAVLDAFRWLALHGVATSKLHMINDFVSMTVLTQRQDEAVSQKGRLLPAELDTLRRKYRVAPWSCGGGLYGTREQVAVQRRLLRRKLSRYGRLIFLTDTRVAMIESFIGLARGHRWLLPFIHVLFRTSLPVLELAPHAHRVLKGIPTEYFVRHAYYRNAVARPDENVDPARDRCGLIWFAPILPLSGFEVMEYLATAKAAFERHEFDFYVALLMMNPRSVIALMAIIYKRDDPEEVARAERLYAQLLEDMRGARLQQYRAGVGAWGEIHSGSPALRNLNLRIKRALDPRNILAPGRYGI